MKKLLLVPALFLLSLFIFSKPVSAEDCKCQYNHGGNPTVIEDNCGTKTPVCSSGPKLGQVSCTCSASCTPRGQVPTPSKPCCDGNLPSVGGVCGPYSTSTPVPVGGLKINSAIGTIPFDSSTRFFSFILSWAIGIGGGIAFFLIIMASFMITTSAGNPERIKAGQELLTSAIAGLIMLVFSVFILRIIGVDILGLGSVGLIK